MPYTGTGFTSVTRPESTSNALHNSCEQCCNSIGEKKTSFRPPGLGEEGPSSRFHLLSETSHRSAIGLDFYFKSLIYTFTPLGSTYRIRPIEFDGSPCRSLVGLVTRVLMSILSHSLPLAPQDVVSRSRCELSLNAHS